MIQFIVSMIRSRHRKMVPSDFQEFQIFIRNSFRAGFCSFFFNFSHVPLSIDQNSTKINKKRAKSESTTTSVRSRDGKVRRSLFGPWSVNVLSTRSSEVKIIMSAFMARRFCQNDNFRSLPVSLSQSKTISKVRTK